MGCFALLHCCCSYSVERVSSKDGYLRVTGGGRKTVGEDMKSRENKRKKKPSAKLKEKVEP